MSTADGRAPRDPDTPVPDIGDPGSGPSDAELITSVRAPGAGPDASRAFGVLYARHVAAARALARQLARSPSDADDLVAGAFTRMLEVLRAGRGPTEAFRAYLLTSVRHLAYDRTRAERRLEVTDDVGGITGVDPDATVVPFQDPAVAGLERTLAAQAFATLPERWQAVLWHLEVEGDAPADIAPLFGLTANAVSALGYRAREGLRQAYLQEHLASGSGRWDRRHRETGGRLGAYTRGGLSRRDAARVEEHLAECAECRSLAGELREVNSGLLRSVVAPLVLGAGLVGYLATRGGTGPVGLDATTGELAVAGGGVLGVLGTLGAFVAPPSGLGRPLPAAPRSALAAAGVLGLAGVGVAAVVLGGGAPPDARPLPAGPLQVAPTAPPPGPPAAPPVPPTVAPVPPPSAAHSTGPSERRASGPSERRTAGPSTGALDPRTILALPDDDAPRARDDARDDRGRRSPERRAGARDDGSDPRPGRRDGRAARADTGCAVTAPLLLGGRCLLDGGAPLDSRR